MALDEPQASRGCWRCPHIGSATTSFFQKSILELPLVRCTPMSTWPPAYCQELLLIVTSHVFPPLSNVQPQNGKLITSKLKGLSENKWLLLSGCISSSQHRSVGSVDSWALLQCCQNTQQLSLLWKNCHRITELCCPPPRYSHGSAGSCFSQPKSLVVSISVTFFA